jgi:hypothetical protein
MHMTVPMGKRSKSLHGPYHCRPAAIPINFSLVYIADGLVSLPAELSQKRPVIAKIHSQSSRYAEYPFMHAIQACTLPAASQCSPAILGLRVTMRHIGKHFFFEPMGKHEGALRSATRADPSLPA